MHAKRITINDPRAGKREGVTVNAVLVREVSPNQSGPAAGVVVVDQSCQFTTRQDVEQIIEYYLQRWMIELFFKVLKSGCQIESRRFEHIDRFPSCVVVCT